MEVSKPRENGVATGATLRHYVGGSQFGVDYMPGDVEFALLPSLKLAKTHVNDVSRTGIDDERCGDDMLAGRDADGTENRDSREPIQQAICELRRGKCGCETCEQS